MQVAQSMSRCASAGERDERALSPARRDVDASYALDTIGFRIEIVGCAQSSFPNCRAAGVFGEFPIKVSGDPLRFRRTHAAEARKPISRKRVLQKKSARLVSPILSPCPTLSPN